MFFFPDYFTAMNYSNQKCIVLHNHIGKRVTMKDNISKAKEMPINPPINIAFSSYKSSYIVTQRMNEIIE